MYFLLLCFPFFALVIQFFSKSIIFAFVAISGVILILSVLFFEEQRKFRYILPSLLTNGFLLFRCIQLHQVYGATVSDYLFASALVAISILLSLVTLIPVPKATPFA